jgi:molybdopterin/thiamine biosynthesis adenylyltransferase
MPEQIEQFDRYQRQTLLPQIGIAGRERLAKARVLLVGCGALGCHLADQLVRAGVGFLRVADRDVVEITNLQRQTLFDERDIGSAKAAAAAKRLGQINSQVTIEPVVADVWAGNIEILSEKIDLILDGTDNVQTRYLLNDAAVKQGIPWVHGACVGTEGRVMPVLPGAGACLRCVFPDPPNAGELPTCDTAGILQPAAAAVASLQAAQAMKILTGRMNATEQRLWKLDIWSGRFASIDVSSGRRDDCACCVQRRFEFLDSAIGDMATTLCGRNAVQIRPAKPWNDGQFDRAMDQLKAVGKVEQSGYFSRCLLAEPPGFTLTCFRDGRLLVQGTSDTGRAKAIYAKYLGS